MIIALEHVDPDAVTPENMARISRNFQVLFSALMQVGLTVTAGHGAPTADTPNGVYFDQDGPPDIYFINVP